MGRRKNTFYFPHDGNARNDEKILSIRMKYGAEGYGIYFMILERLLESSKYMSVKVYNEIAFDLRVDTGKVKSIIEDFGLFSFTEDGECFYSESFINRMEPLDRLRKQRQDAGKKSAEKRTERVGEVMRSLQKKSTVVQRSLTKKATERVDEINNNVLLEKEPKEREYIGGKNFSKTEKKINPLNHEEKTLSKSCGKKFSLDEPQSQKEKKFKPPTAQEVQDYCNERENGISGEAFVNFYQSKDWMIGKNKMKDWKAAIRTWEQKRKEEKKNETTNHTKPGNNTNYSAGGKKPTRKISAITLLARQLNENTRGDNDGGNHTAETETCE